MHFYKYSALSSNELKAVYILLPTARYITINGHISVNHWFEKSSTMLRYSFCAAMYLANPLTHPFKAP